MKRTLIAVAAGALVLVGLALVLARPVALAVGRALVRADDPAVAPVDAIVVLGGDVHKRAPYAATLFLEGLSPVLVAVGGTADQGELSEARKTTRVLLAAGVPEGGILALGIDEPSTVDEASATAELVALKGWAHIAIVTSPYHTLRAGRMFEDALHDAAGDDVRVTMLPSPLDPFDPDAWWQDERQSRQVRNEYGKFLLWKLSGR